MKAKIVKKDKDYSKMGWWFWGLILGTVIGAYTTRIVQIVTVAKSVSEGLEE